MANEETIVDDKRFDQIARALGGVTGRRQAVRTIFGGAAAALGVAGLAAAEANAKGNRNGKKGKGKGKHHKSGRAARPVSCSGGKNLPICHTAQGVNPHIICVDPNGCDGHGNHPLDCVCDSTSHVCTGSQGGTLDPCASCNFVTGDCSKSCIVEGLSCSAPSQCCSGLTCIAGTCQGNTCHNSNQCSSGQQCCGGQCVSTSVCCSGNALGCNNPNNPNCCPDANGNGTCTNTQTDVDNCGDCGIECKPEESCVNGQCQTQGCQKDTDCGPSGFVCCGGVCHAGNCCEPAACNPKASAKRKRGKARGVDSSETCCDFSCVDLDNDPNNCGDCGIACDPDDSCISGNCTPPGCGEGGPCGNDEFCCGGTCIADTLCCTENQPGCGSTDDVCCKGTCFTGTCCADTDCGGAHTSRKAGKGAQPAGAPSGGVCCNHVCCPPGDVCSGDNQCVPSCQSQGQICNVERVCCGGLTCDPTSSTCQPPHVGCTTNTDCTGGTICCNQICVDPNSPDHCGTCDTVCKAGEDCIAQTCVAVCGGIGPCDDGLTCCGTGDAAQCVDTSSDNNNCGACGTVCPVGSACQNSQCVNTCMPEGGDCTAENCCAPFVCGAGNICRQCTPEGQDCSLAECCSPDFTCNKQNTCVHAGGGGGGGGGGGADCFHVGGKPVPGKPCCPRLHEEKGRCVINRWDHCDQSNQGQRSWCEKGTTCEGGRISPHHQEVCVPKGYRRRQRRRHRQGLGSSATSTTPAAGATATPAATPVS